MTNHDLVRTCAGPPRREQLPDTGHSRSGGPSVDLPGLLRRRRAMGVLLGLRGRCTALTQSHPAPAGEPRRLRLHGRAVPRPCRVCGRRRPRAVRRRLEPGARDVSRAEPSRRSTGNTRGRDGIIAVPPLPGDGVRPVGPVPARAQAALLAARSRSGPPGPRRITLQPSSAAPTLASGYSNTKAITLS